MAVAGCYSVSVLALLSSGIPAFARQAPQSDQAPITVTTREVLIDAVVRDKRQKLVKDLTAADFQIFEDGVPQTLTTFRFAGGADAASVSNSAEAHRPGRAANRMALDPLREINLVAVVIDSLGPEGRRNLLDAGRAIVGNGLRANTFMGVFTVDMYKGLQVLQPFTQDNAALLQTIERLAGRAPDSGPQSGGLDVFLNQTQTTTATTVAGDATGPGGGLRGAASSISVASMARFEADVMMELSSKRQLLSLLALVKSLADFPGRKSVLYFSQGFQVAGVNSDLFQAAISTANQGQVTFYAFDVIGLRMESPLADARSMLNQAVAESNRMQQDANYRGSDAIGMAVDSTHANVQSNLVQLAEGTGGFFISGVGSIGKSLDRIAEDVQTHYEFAYSPSSGVMDGHFRKISIKLRRPNLTVQSRNGYYALPLLPGETLLPFELGAMNALSAPAPPRSFPFSVAALRFRSGSRATLFSLSYEVPIAALRASEDKKAKRFEIRICFFSLIKDANGQVVRKVSQEVPYAGALDKLESFRHGSVVQTQPFIVEPGRYTIVSALIDRNAETASTRRTSLIVPEPAALQVSDLVLVRRLEHTAQDAAQQYDPLVTSIGKITPALSSVVEGGPGAKLNLFCQVYARPAAGSAANSTLVPLPEIVASLTRQGEAPTRLAAVALATTASGGIPYIMTLNLEQFAPGDYVAKVTARQGSSAVSAAISFSVKVPTSEAPPATALHSGIPVEP